MGETSQIGYLRHKKQRKKSPETANLEKRGDKSLYQVIKTHEPIYGDLTFMHIT